MLPCPQIFPWFHLQIPTPDVRFGLQWVPQWYCNEQNIGIINHLLYGFRSHLLFCDKLIRELKQPPPPRQPQKTIGFLSKTTALLLRRETSYSITATFYGGRWTYDGEFSVLFLKLDILPKNSTAGKVGHIWHIERVQIDAIKVDSVGDIHFLATFSLPSLSSLLKLPRFPVGNSLYAPRITRKRSFFFLQICRNKCVYLDGKASKM